MHMRFERRQGQALPALKGEQSRTIVRAQCLEPLPAGRSLGERQGGRRGKTLCARVRVLIFRRVRLQPQNGSIGMA